MNLGTYYRKWNIVVHEWLYHYVYLDSMRLFKGRCPRVIAQLATFLLSAIIHEVILTPVLGFFFPILFVLFVGPGVTLFYATQNFQSRVINVVFWALMFISQGFMFSLYFKEHFARRDANVNQEKWGYWYYLVPRSILHHLDHNGY